MRIAPQWLQDADLQRLMAALADGGYRVLVVGGAVRNTLMGRAISDIDLASDARPDAVISLATGAGFRCVPTGIDHGTVTVVGAESSFEVTTFRRDLAPDGRHARVDFTDDLAADAARRDFTMNALYLDAAGQVFDTVGGLDDIAEGRVRFVGDPQARIAEDYLRILRYFRFVAVYGNPDLGMDADALAACATHAEGLDRLSKERIGQEMRKLLAARDPAPAVAAMATAGILARLLPGADPRALAPLVHAEAGAPRGWLARLALLGGEDVPDALRLSRAEAGKLSTIRAEIAAGLPISALGWRHGVDLGGDILHARAALLGQTLPDDWRDQLDRGAAATCPISAADFMPDLQGPALGAALARATQHWLDSDLRADKAELLNR